MQEFCFGVGWDGGYEEDVDMNVYQLMFTLDLKQDVGSSLESFMPVSQGAFDLSSHLHKGNFKLS